MTVAELTKRVEALEREIAQIRKELNGPRNGEPWWRAVAGEFADDPDFEEAVRLGREYRESLQPKTCSADE